MRSLLFKLLKLLVVNMAQYKVLKRFRLFDDPQAKTGGDIKEVGQIIDITVKRANEVEKNLDSSFLERVIEKNDEEGAK